MPKVGRRSEHPSHDYLRRDNRVLANAPFGTLYTPNIRMRIVGGRPIQIIEGEPLPEEITQQTQSLQPSPRDALLYSEPEKNQNGYSTAQPDRYSSHLHQQPMNPHPVLPPIPSRTPNPPARTPNPMEQQTLESHRSDLPQDIRRLYRLLPRDTYLPREPLFLRREEELTLSRHLKEELSKYGMSKIKDVYMDLLSLDRNMTSYVPYQDLSQMFTKNQVHLHPQLLRLVAALYVSTREYGLVNYEKVITFIGGAAKMAQTERFQSPPPTVSKAVTSPQPQNISKHVDSPRDISYDRPYYYNPSNSPKPRERNSSPKRSPVRDRDDAKLVRLIEAQFLCAPDTVDIEKLRALFSEADRTHRGSLSRQQIKQVALLCRLPLQESILDRIVDRCDDRGLGQYNWMQFQEFIERIQPASTGLRIPTSKKPREYAKHFPVPASNWPRAESPNPSPTPRQSRSPERQTYNPVQPKSSDKQLNSIKKEIRKLEDQYQELKERIVHDQKCSPREPAKPQMASSRDLGRPWFDRYLKLADALYKNDVDNNGRLRSDEVKWLTDEFDTVYDLNLPSQLKEEALQRALCDGDIVDLNSYIKILGMANA